MPTPSRALILADIEGIVGVDDWRDIISGLAGYAAACRAYAADVNAAVRGLRAGGAAEVLVVDTHGAGTNLAPADIVGAELIGDPSIMARIDAAIARGVDALALVGFHAAAGTPDGFVPHSFNPQTRSWLDDHLAGEPAFYALMLGNEGISTTLITGDARTLEQLRPFAPNARGVQTKRSDSPWVAASFDPEPTRAAIAAAAADGYRARAGIAPSTLPAPMALTLEAQHEVGARLIAGIPGVERRADGGLIYRGAWPEVWRAFVTANSLAALAGTAGGSWFHGPIGGSLVERLRGAAGDAAGPAFSGFYADQFSPPWGPACPPEAMP